MAGALRDFPLGGCMEKPFDVVAIVGSLRRDSFTRRLVRSFDALAPAAMKIEIVEIRELSLYNQDDEAAPPAPWVNFRNRIKRADAVLFATPEYNRSVPGCSQECDRCRIAALRRQRMVRQTGCHRQRLTRGDGRLRRKSSSAPVVGVSGHADAAATGGVHRPGRQTIRRVRRIRQSVDAGFMQQVSRNV